MKEFLTANIWLKLASLVIAVALWFFVMLSGRSEVTMDVPIEFVNTPPKSEIVDYPKTISVIIEGQERLLRYLKQNEISAVLDISEAKGGRTFYTITKEHIRLPKSFLVTGIDPETISITIEVQLQKVVKVKPHVTGSPETGFKIVEITVEPETVTLEGPKSAVSKIKIIKTEPIDIKGIKSDLVYKANLKLSNPQIKKNIEKVDVKLTVEPIKKETSKNERKKKKK
jgi:YbbR domain-containing protein